MLLIMKLRAISFWAGVRWSTGVQFYTIGRRSRRFTFSDAGWAGAATARFINAAFVSRDWIRGLQIPVWHQFGEFSQTALAVHPSSNGAPAAPNQTERSWISFFGPVRFLHKMGDRALLNKEAKTYWSRFPGFKDALIKYFVCNPVVPCLGVSLAAQTASGCFNGCGREMVQKPLLWGIGGFP